MAVQHPIITYRLRRDGSVPPFLCDHPGAFAGLYGVDTNKPGYIPAWLPPQDTQYLGMACGPIDPDGSPSCVKVIATKTALGNYIAGISTDWKNRDEVVTGVSTSIQEGPIEAFGNPDRESEIVVTNTPAVTYTVTEGTVISTRTDQNVSDRSVSENGTTTLTRTTTITEVSMVETPFDPVAATNELWAKYQAVNGL